MPITRYIVWVGASLLALLFVVNWFLPEPLPEPAHAAIDKPVIRIASIQPSPERVVIDTSQPTIAPPPAPFDGPRSGNPSLLRSYASVDPAPMVPVTADSAKKRPKAAKRREGRVTAHEPALPSAPAIARGAATPVPSSRVSFADIVSGRLVRELFNLH
jgi:hypothetical protein